MLDNGLSRISNLTPVAMTLQMLCLCDQNITVIENLELPHLQELYLHRNQISEIKNLTGCPRLRKLWLFQNNLTSIKGLHAVPELEECWLQANQLQSLKGLEYTSNLISLGLAGNPIGEFKELKRLSSCKRLRDISFSDIHFGRCPIAEEEGYRDFIILHFRHISILDGVKIAKQAQDAAEDTYFKQIKHFNDSLREVEESYQKNLRLIDSQHQSRETYSQLLQKEMSAALSELQGLVNEGRKIINQEVSFSRVHPCSCVWICHILY